MSQIVIKFHHILPNKVSRAVMKFDILLPSKISVKKMEHNKTKFSCKNDFQISKGNLFSTENNTC